MASTWVNVTDLVFPPMEQMTFGNDCSIYGQWYTGLTTPNPWNPSDGLGGSIQLSIAYLWDALPMGWEYPENVTEAMVFSQMVQFTTDNLYWSFDEDEQLWDSNPVWLEHAINKPMDKCPAEFCKALGRTGNADVTGIGVQVSYYVEAILATMYLLAYTIWQIRRYYEKKAHKNSLPGVPHIHRTFTGSSGKAGRVLDAFRGSLASFLSGTMLLALVMLVASVCLAAEKTKTRKLPELKQDIPTGSALYDISLSLLAATFSVFPVMLLYALMKDPDRGAEGGHRKWMRRSMLLLMWCLGVTEMFLGPRGELDYDDRHKKYSLYYCDRRGGSHYWHGLKAGQWLVIGAPLTWIVLTTFVVTGFWIPGVAEKPWVRRWRACWRLTVAWINLILMWGVLAYFTYLRHGIIKLAGGLDNEDKWTFGQILALATWAPVVADWFYILIFGLQEGLTDRLPQDYQAIHKNGQPSPNFDDKVPLIESYAITAVPPASVGGPTPGHLQVVGTGYHNSPPPPEMYFGPTGSWNSRTNSWETKQNPWEHWNSTGW